MHQRRDPACGTQRVEPDEARDVVLIVVPHVRDRLGFNHGNQQTPIHPFWQGQSRMATKIPLLTV